MPAFAGLVFAVLLGVLVFVPENINLLARLETKESSEFAHYEQLFDELELVDLNQNKVSLSGLKSPVVVLNFWASWCKPCLEEFPSLVNLRNEFSESELAVIGINSDEEEQEKNIAKMTEQFGLNFISVADQESQLLNKFMINTLPVTIIYQNGKVYKVSKGKKDFMAEEFLEFVRSSQKMPL